MATMAVRRAPFRGPADAIGQMPDAGFSTEEIATTAKPTALTIEGRQAKEDESVDRSSDEPPPDATT